MFHINVNDIYILLFKSEFFFKECAHNHKKFYIVMKRIQPFYVATEI